MRQGHGRARGGARHRPPVLNLALVECVAKEGCRLCVGSSCGVGIRKRVQHHEVVDDSAVPSCGDVDACLAKATGVSVVLVAEDVTRGVDYTGVWKASELIGRSPKLADGA